MLPPPPSEPLPPRPPQPRRFATGAVLGGVGLAFAVLVAQGLLVVAGSSLLNDPTPVVVLSGLLGIGALVAAVVLTVRHGSPTRRGLGLGYLIGTALIWIVGAGLCIAAVVAITQSLQNG